jgi:hypothetical protein
VGLNWRADIEQATAALLSGNSQIATLTRQRFLGAAHQASRYYAAGAQQDSTARA